MVERVVDQPELAQYLDRGVHDCGIAPGSRSVPNDSDLVIRCPRMLGDPSVRSPEEPAARQPDLHRALELDKGAQRCEEVGARYLVVVEPEDPVARALFVEPAKPSIERCRIDS